MMIRVGLFCVCKTPSADHKLTFHVHISQLCIICIESTSDAPLFQSIELTNFLVFKFADLVLKDKIFVYDLAHQRIGWANYDCKFTTGLLLTHEEYI